MPIANRPSRKKKKAKTPPDVELQDPEEPGDGETQTSTTLENEPLEMQVTAADEVEPEKSAQIKRQVI